MIESQNLHVHTYRGKKEGRKGEERNKGRKKDTEKKARKKFKY